jgi:hypothetical protein
MICNDLVKGCASNLYLCLCYFVARSCCRPLRVICVLGLGLSKPNSFLVIYIKRPAG